MRHGWGTGHNERVDTEEPREWRQWVREAWRPEPHGEPLTRKAALADLVFAIVLTVLALMVAAKAGSQDMLQEPAFQGPVPPPPVLPDGVQEIAVQPGTVAWPFTVLTTLPLA